MAESTQTDSFDRNDRTIMPADLRNAWNSWAYVPGNDKANVSAYADQLLSAAEQTGLKTYMRQAAMAVMEEAQYKSTATAADGSHPTYERALDLLARASSGLSSPAIAVDLS